MKNIKKDLNLELNNPKGFFNLKEEDLFEIAVRKNLKRNFLFVSKLIGKHIPMNASSLFYTGALLAEKFAQETYNESIYEEEDCINMVNAIKTNTKLLKDNISPRLDKEKVLVIGFAETATGLGFSFFKNFSNSYYVHTTRENCEEDLLFGFEEEHSHATGHRCYFKNKEILSEIDRIILVDDEFTTGNTCLNLINEMNNLYPGKKYTLVSILDWRNKSSKSNFEEYSTKNNVEINVVSLFSGEIDYKHEIRTFNDNTNFKNYSNLTNGYLDVHMNLDPLTYNGNIEVQPNIFAKIENVAKDIIETIKPSLLFGNTLILGFEENIFLPSIVANKLDSKFASITLSPIYPNTDFEDKYPIKNAFRFQNFEKNLFLYNLTPDYNNVVILVDKKLDENAKNNISGYLSEEYGVKKVIFVNIERKM
jgi:hypothetical protein